jgi:integrase
VRLLQIRDIDLEIELVRIRQKGGDLAYQPIVFPDVLQTLAEHLTLDGREAAEYLLYPRWERTLKTGEHVLQRARERPLSDRGMHEWWQRCLRRADVPHFPMHELRHTAGTEFHRANHDLELTRRFMRHRSPVTTSEHYMHLDQRELADAMLRAHARWAE